MQFDTIVIMAAFALSTYLAVHAFTGAYVRKILAREYKMKQLFGHEVKVDNHIYNHAVEDTLLGALADDIHNIKEAVYSGEWIYAQRVGAYIYSSNIATDNVFGRLSIFACPLDFYTPQIAIRNGSRKKFLVSHVQTRIRNQELVWCEAGFDKNHDIYNEPGMQVDTLSILSPEVLDVLQHAPKNADILLKRNILYYYIPGSHAPEKILPALLEHKQRALAELNDNLYRWARSAANQDKVAAIKATELAVTPRERFRRMRKDLNV